LIAAGLVAILAVPVKAATPPQQLFNKSILLNWSEGRSQQFPDGRENHVVVHSTTHIYVSGAGRMFLQSGRERINRSGKTIASVGATSSPDGSFRTANQHYKSAVSFDGRTFTSVLKYESGARRVMATFDEGFRSCTLSVVHGKEEGSPGHVQRGMTGRLLLVKKVDISGATCSVKDGNVFGE
jgi:hypothetical protein